MKGFLILLRKEVQEQWRNSRIVAIAAIFLLFGLQAPLTVYYTPELIAALAPEMNLVLPAPVLAQALSEVLESLGLLTIAAILLSMGAVAHEKERGTAALVLSRPAGRMAFLLAKFCALALTLAIGALLCGLGGYYYSMVLFEAPPLGGFIAACALMLLSTLVYTALTLLGSVLVRSPLPAAGMGLGALLLLSVLGVLPRISDWLPAALSASAGAFMLQQPAEQLASGLTGSIALILAALLVAWLSFRRQEL